MEQQWACVRSILPQDSLLGMGILCYGFNCDSKRKRMQYAIIGVDHIECVMIKHWRSDDIYTFDSLVVPFRDQSKNSSLTALTEWFTVEPVPWYICDSKKTIGGSKIE